MKQFVLILFSLFVFQGFSQDTLKVLTLEQYLQHVKENHPYAIVASNQVEQAEQVIRMSKGAFDPVAFAGIDQKYYDGKMYYSTLTSGLKIPTRLGIDFKVAGDWNRGEYLNEEHTLPNGGLTYLGVEVPIGRGLFTDERRTQLRRSQVALNQSIFEQQLTLNELLYEAGQHFINLQEQNAQLELAEEGFRIAQIRYNQIKIESEIGERAFLDTVEASAQLFLRQVDVQQRRLNRQNALLAVEVFLWEKGTLPLKLDTSLQIEKISKATRQALPNVSIDQNPDLLLYSTKLSDLELERRLKVEQLKPQLNFNYNLLQTPDDLISMNLDYTNYKWGASFYMPLFLRKERSSLQVTKLKIENTQFQQIQKQRELETKLLQNRQNWVVTLDQMETSETIAQRYFLLSEAERNFFNIGESSLFLVNAREISYLSAQSKYLEFIAKAYKFNLTDRYVRGELGR
ncbi:MAG: TolC family protein [Fluviicola sp.]